MYIEVINDYICIYFINIIEIKYKRIIIKNYLNYSYI